MVVERGKESGRPSSKYRWPVRLLLLCSLCALAALVWVILLPEHRRERFAGWPSQRAAIQQGRPGAVAEAIAAALGDWQAALPTLQDMLTGDDWPGRAAACEILAERLDRRTALAVAPRCSDSDWRVRAAAFAALGRLRPVPPSASLQNMPLARREQALLAWMDDYDASVAGGAGSELCELYADDRHVEVGKDLLARCLVCHAGSSPASPEASEACAGCHAEVHADWSASAHANSLTHLQLVTINPRSRQAEAVDFGPLRGIGCLECHRLDASHAQPASMASAPASSAPSGRACPFVFDASRPAGDSCRRCHGSTFQQWQAWRSGRQPRHADWPPGQIDLDRRGDERTCVDCHMPPAQMQPADSQPPGGHRDHRWSARRNVLLLQQGLDAQVIQTGGIGAVGQARLVLTNLAGHDYPTGSRRRAIQVLLAVRTTATQPSGGTEQRVLAAFSPVRPGAVWADSHPALSPGQQQMLALPAELADDNPAYRIDYVGNVFSADSHRAQIVARPEQVWQGGTGQP